MPVGVIMVVVIMLGTIMAVDVTDAGIVITIKVTTIVVTPDDSHILLRRPSGAHASTVGQSITPGLDFRCTELNRLARAGGRQSFSARVGRQHSPAGFRQEQSRANQNAIGKDGEYADRTAKRQVGTQ